MCKKLDLTGSLAGISSWRLTLGTDAVSVHGNTVKECMEMELAIVKEVA